MDSFLKKKWRRKWKRERKERTKKANLRKNRRTRKMNNKLKLKLKLMGTRKMMESRAKLKKTYTKKSLCHLKSRFKNSGNCTSRSRNSCKSSWITSVIKKISKKPIRKWKQQRGKSKSMSLPWACITVSTMTINWVTNKKNSTMTCMMLTTFLLLKSDSKEGHRQRTARILWSSMYKFAPF